jgi:asparagine synthetase B (glutamine-hydrolysing)
MFTLAIDDTVAQLYYWPHDRFGIKALFTRHTKNRPAFASDIRELLELLGVDIRPTETFHARIRALQPGEKLEAWLDGHKVS